MRLRGVLWGKCTYTLTLLEITVFTEIPHRIAWHYIENKYTKRGIFSVHLEGDLLNSHQAVLTFYVKIFRFI